jgi:hypothetical protein
MKLIKHSSTYLLIIVLFQLQHVQPLEVGPGVVRHDTSMLPGNVPGSDIDRHELANAKDKSQPINGPVAASLKNATLQIFAQGANSSKAPCSMQQAKIKLRKGHAAIQSDEPDMQKVALGMGSDKTRRVHLQLAQMPSKSGHDPGKVSPSLASRLMHKANTHNLSATSLIESTTKLSPNRSSFSPIHTIGTFAASIDDSAVAPTSNSSFAKVIVAYWKKHGLLGSVYREGYWMQPNLLLGIALIIFIIAQVVALACVAQHAQASWEMLRKSKDPHPHKLSRFGELIPGISFGDVPPESRQHSADATGQARSNLTLHQRRAKEHALPNGVGSEAARENWSFWTKRAAMASRLPEELDAERHVGSALWPKVSRSTAEWSATRDAQFEKTPRDEGASLQSTVNYATSRADLNKRILAMLQQSPEQISSIDSMLTMEYDAMMQSDVDLDRAMAANEP